MSKNETESTMKFKVDIAQLKAGMQEAKRSINIANSEFKAATASMDNWGKSTEGLGAKLKQLDSSLNSQKKILGILEDQYELTVKEMGAGSKAAQDLEVRINNQKAVIAKTENQIKNYNTKLKDLEKSNQDAAGALGKLNSRIEEQEATLNDLKKEYQNVVLEQGKTSAEAKRLMNEITDLSKELKENKDTLQDSAAAADKLDKSLKDVGENAGNTEGGFTVLKGALASLAAEGIKQVVEGFKNLVTESSKASASFQASTGASTEAMSEYNREMQKLDNNNFGEDLNDIADAMAEVRQQTGELDSGKLEEMTRDVIVLRDVFGFDFKESIRAVKMLMDQFGISAEEAFNLIVQGAQNGLNKNDDLLDTINEYSPYWKRMGLSAEESFNTLYNGAEAGTFSIDKLGDAYKEFNIRVQDTADTTTEAFEMMGLDADKLRIEFAKGGDAAKNATEVVIQNFKKMEDPVKRNQVGVDLWGTMYEDLGESGVMALMDISGQASKTADTMKQITEVKYNDMESQLKEVGKALKNDLLMPIVKELLPVIKSSLTWVKKNLPAIVPILKTVGAAVAAAFSIKAFTSFNNAVLGVTESLLTLTGRIPQLQKALSALQAFLTKNPWVALATAVLSVAGAILVFGDHESEATKKIKENEEAAKENLQAWNDMSDARQEAIENSTGEIDYLSRLKTELTGLTDENGKVKEGYQNRANFILNELSTAFGVEISMIDGVIQKYDEQMATLDELMNKKRAKAIIDAGEDAYTKAIQNQTTAWEEARQAQADYQEKIELWEETAENMRKHGMDQSRIDMAEKVYFNSEEVKSVKNTMDQKRKLAEEYTETIARQEYLQQLYARGTAEDIAEINSYIAKTYDDKGRKVVLSTQEQIKNETDLLNYLKKRYKETNDEMYKDQIRGAEDRLNKLKDELDGQKTTIGEKTEEYGTSWAMLSEMGLFGFSKYDEGYMQSSEKKVDNAAAGINGKHDSYVNINGMLAAAGLTQFQLNNQLYSDAGAEKGQYAAEGVNSKKGSMLTAGTNLILGLLAGLLSNNGSITSAGISAGNSAKDGAVAANNDNQFYGVGADYATGIGNGVNSKSSWLWDITFGIGGAMLKALRQSLDEHSPSKETYKDGEHFMQGMANGIIGNIRTVTGAIKKAGGAMLEEAKTSIPDINSTLNNASYSIASSRQGTVQNSKSSGAQIVNFNQVINSPKARSRLEIYRDTNRLLFAAKGGLKNV